ncbi:MAG: hypothetical protein ABR585_12490 [Gemmatimonadaceae bacterium]|nr:hypothetical protein [Actinomycetota bacterium]
MGADVINRATTTVTVYRGSTYNAWGDEVDSDTIVATGVRASILEQTVDAKTEITTVPHSYRFAKMRVTAGTDIRQNDRIMDEKTQEVWTIVQISRRANPVCSQDIRVDLEMMG